LDRAQPFYVDQQWCAAWYLNSDGTVGLGYDDPELVVASSLPEFLTRIDLENQAWYDRYHWYHNAIRDWNANKIVN
jgi:hypothetical protein